MRKHPTHLDEQIHALLMVMAVLPDVADSFGSIVKAGLDPGIVAEFIERRRLSLQQELSELKVDRDDPADPMAEFQQAPDSSTVVPFPFPYSTKKMRPR